MSPRQAQGSPRGLRLLAVPGSQDRKHIPMGLDELIRHDLDRHDGYAVTGTMTIMSSVFGRL